MNVNSQVKKTAFAYAYANMLNERKKFYHVTLAYLGNKFVEFGVNKSKTHPALVEYGYEKYSFIHSELDLLLKLNKTKFELGDIDVINFCFAQANVRKNRKIYRISRPCKYCSTFVFDEFKSVMFYYNNEWHKL